MSDYRLPAEWEAQSSVWIAWPVKENIWPNNQAEIKKHFASLISLLAVSIQTNVICKRECQHELLSLIAVSREELNIVFFDIESDDVWCRDFGPLITINSSGSRQIIDWQFNAWGAKHPYTKDNQVNSFISQATGIPRKELSLILEGGAIEVNGQGVLLTTEEVLLNKNRNKGITKKDYEHAFESIGIEKVIWLKKGLLNDDTDGHIDNICRFISETAVLLASCSLDNPNYDRLLENRRILESTLIKGRKLDIIDLPLPEKLYSDNEKLPASYLNYIILNDIIVCPAYGQNKDSEARKIIQKAFPDRRVVSFPCNLFLKEGGALHCLTMNQV